ncbi:unnamed protein product [Paramecium octaurelia]|uniref:G-protein coupled receptors family 2 profile 2 domain-containing protein n=1 Tax=Paramecium octaurelia TaxID=43137 RepID=A0A8S1U521_PAROT|nr:unnamed protein product [Paramecium octaurelia]
MQTYEIIITIGNCLSLCGALVIFFLFFHFQKLRQGFFSHTIIYITIGSLIQIIGIQLSSSYGMTNCKVSVSVLICGSLIMIFWSTIMIWALKKLFNVYLNKGSLQELESMHNQLRNNEFKLLLCSFGIPILLAIWPAVLDGATSEQQTNNFCYLYTTSHQTSAVKIQVEIAKLISWEIPIIFYLIYSLMVLYNIKKFYEEIIDEIIFVEVKQIVKRLLAYPIITILCSFLFTIMDLETFFNVEIGGIQSTISWTMLSLWEFFNFFAYISQSSVQEEVFRGNSKEQELNPLIPQDLEESINERDYFYQINSNMQESSQQNN